MPDKFIITAITQLIRRRIYIRVATAVVTNHFLPIIPCEPAMTNCTREKKLFSLAIFCCFHHQVELISKVCLYMSLFSLQGVYIDCGIERERDCDIQTRTLIIVQQTTPCINPRPCIG